MIKKQILYIFIIMVLVPSAMAAGDFDTPIPTPIQLTIPTYDGSGQTVHPDVVYFPNSWNGYKYWMAITPYPNGNGAYENPSILISNDGKSWSVPNGLTNPVVQKPSGIAENEDPELVFNKALNRLELYYGEGGAGTSYLKRKTSMDGVTWSPAQTSISLPDWYIMSPSIVKNDNSYNLWYTSGANCSADITVKYTNSADGIGFSSPQSVNFNQNVNVWHINVEYIPTRNEYWMVYAAYPKGSTCGNTDLYFAKSTDKINWISSGDKILPRASFYTSEVYRSSFLFDETTNIMKLWISGRNGNVWRTGYSEVPIITYPITPTPTPTPTPTVSPTNPNAYWNFNDGTGLVATDNSGNGNNVTLMNGLAWTTGKIGTALQFDGNDYARASSSQSLNITSGSVTITAWVYANSTGWRAIVGKGESAAEKDHNYMLELDSNGKALFAIGNGIGYYGVLTTVGIGSGWHHIAAVFNNTSDTRIYFDGVQKTTAIDPGSNSAVRLTANNKRLTIGDLGAGTDYFKGKIDEVKIYNKGLSPAEVLAEYNRI